MQSIWEILKSCVYHCFRFWWQLRLHRLMTVSGIYSIILSTWILSICRRRASLAFQQSPISRLLANGFSVVLACAAQIASATAFGGKLHLLYVLASDLRALDFRTHAGKFLARALHWQGRGNQTEEAMVGSCSNGQFDYTGNFQVCLLRYGLR